MEGGKKKRESALSNICSCSSTISTLKITEPNGLLKERITIIRDQP